MSLTQQKLSQSILSFLAHVGRLSIVLSLLASGMAHATNTERDQARRMHDRLAGVPPTNAVLDIMEGKITAGDSIGAAEEAIKNPSFYNVTLKNYVAPWTNEAQDVFVKLNDYTATVIGVIREDYDFRRILYDDILFTGNNTPAYSSSNNDHYLALDALGPVAGDLSDDTILVETTQSFASTTTPKLPIAATAGVITTRASAEAFFTDGTNRSMFRFTFMNQLCTDIEALKDVSRVPDRVRQDVSRSPGGDSRIYMFSCVGCHAGMDSLTGAFSKYNFNTVTGEMDYARTDAAALADESLNGYVANGVSAKYQNNAGNFPSGYITTDESWVNYWRNGQNSLLGWGFSTDLPSSVVGQFDIRGHATGEGAKSMGAELANSKAFASCQVKKAFKAVCLRDPGNAADRAEVERITTDVFQSSGYNMKSVFANVAVFCSK